VPRVTIRGAGWAFDTSRHEGGFLTQARSGWCVRCDRSKHQIENVGLQEVNMSNAFSRACTLFAVVGGLGIGACASPSTPSVIPPAGDVGSGPTAISPGVTDTTLVNTGWTCRTPTPSLTVCAPPGLGFPPRPPIPDNGGAPSYTIWAFVNHEFDHRVKYIRPDLYQGQPCLGDEPYTLFGPVNYYECIMPAR